MKIEMTSDKKASENGYTVKHFKKGEQYEVSENLGVIFVKKIKCAVELTEIDEQDHVKQDESTENELPDTEHGEAEKMQAPLNNKAVESPGSNKRNSKKIVS